MREARHSWCAVSGKFHLASTWALVNSFSCAVVLSLDAIVKSGVLGSGGSGGRKGRSCTNAALFSGGLNTSSCQVALPGVTCDRKRDGIPPPRRSKGMLYVVLATCDCGSLRAMRFRKNGRMRPRLAMARVRRPVHVQNADGYAALHSCKVYVVT